MSSINDVTSYNEESYRVLKNFIDDSYIELSVFGYRNVYSLGHKGCITFEYLVKKIDYFVKSNPLYDTSGSHTVDSTIADNIWKLYKISEEQIERANFITLFFLEIFNIFFKPYHHPLLMDYLMDTESLSSNTYNLSSF